MWHAITVWGDLGDVITPIDMRHSDLYLELWIWEIAGASSLS
jgi:hypothetical protein